MGQEEQHHPARWRHHAFAAVAAARDAGRSKTNFDGTEAGGDKACGGTEKLGITVEEHGFSHALTRIKIAGFSPCGIKRNNLWQQYHPNPQARQQPAPKLPRLNCTSFAATATAA